MKWRKGTAHTRQLCHLFESENRDVRRAAFKAVYEHTAALKTRSFSRSAEL